MLDAHCHILPGVDDGVSNLYETEDILSKLRSYGIDKVICTSHIKGKFKGFNEQIEAFSKVIPIAKKYNIDIKQGFEVHWRELADIGFENAINYCFGDSKFFFLEFSHSGLPYNWENIIYRLQAEGLSVIIAHPERYPEIYSDINIAKKMSESGCYMMLSANFMNKKFLNAPLKKRAKKLLKAGLVDMICSDAHSIDGYKWLEPAYKFAKKYGFDVNSNEKILLGVFS